MKARKPKPIFCPTCGQSEPQPTEEPQAPSNLNGQRWPIVALLALVVFMAIVAIVGGI